MSGSDRQASRPTLTELARLELFVGSTNDEVAAATARLAPVDYGAGAPIMRRGEPGDFFLLLVEGQARVDAIAHHEGQAAVVGAGSVVGELSLLRGEARSATVHARTPLRGLRGDHAAFVALLGVDGVGERLRRTAARRLATDAEPVELPIRDGSVFVRPVLLEDWELLVEGLRQASPELLRLRFFSGGRPPDQVVRYLVDIDYVNHFAWAAFGDRDAGRDGIASGRYIRLRDEPTTAEIALGVLDRHQGRGVGATLCRALSVAASVAGIGRFRAERRVENVAVRSLLDRAGAVWVPSEPGVVATVVDSQRLGDGLDDDAAVALETVARAIIGAARVGAV